MRIAKVSLVVLGFMLPFESVSFGQHQSTAILSQEFQRLYETPPEGKSGLVQRRREAQRAEEHLSSFLLHQLEASPSISPCELQQQLGRILRPLDSARCRDQDWDENLGYAPRVFTSNWRPNASRQQVALTYVVSLGCMGPGCTAIVFENYLVESGKARRTVRTDNLLSGCLTQTELLVAYPDKEEYWVLVSAMMTGTSGRFLPRQALLLRIGVDSIQVLWQTPVLSNLEAHAHRSALRWEMSYADRSLPDGTADPYSLDIYQLDYGSEKFRRIVHQRYTPSR